MSSTASMCQCHAFEGNEVQNDMGNDEDIYVDEYDEILNIDNELICRDSV